MKTKVLGYSKDGVYVEVENSFSSVVFDFNTTDNSCVESTEPWARYSEYCNYTLSDNEKEVLTEAFNSLFN